MVSLMRSSSTSRMNGVGLGSIPAGTMSFEAITRVVTPMLTSKPSSSGTSIRPATVTVRRSPPSKARVRRLPTSRPSHSVASFGRSTTQAPSPGSTSTPSAISYSIDSSLASEIDSSEKKSRSR